MLQLYLDEDSLSRVLIKALRGTDIDFLTAAEAGNTSLTDELQLAYAARAGRAIYTANVHDYARLHRDWMRSGRTHSGIVALSDQLLPVTLQVKALLSLATTVSLDMMQDGIFYINNWLGQ